MKLKLRQIDESMKVLELLGGETFSGKISYIIQRNVKKINEETTYMRDSLREVFNNYAEKKDGGEEDELIIPEFNKESYLKELNDLFNQEIDVDIIQISLDEFDHSISPAQMSKIDWMFKFDE